MNIPACTINTGTDKFYFPKFQIHQLYPHHNTIEYITTTKSPPRVNFVVYGWVDRC